MAEKKVLWLTGQKDYEDRLTGALIDADQVYDAVYIESQGIRVWVEISGDTEIKIPEIIIWEDEEYKSLKDMDSNDMRDYLDSLVGQEGKEMSEEYTASGNYLVFDYYNNEFANLSDWVTVKAYGYICNSNYKTITLDTDNEYGYNEEYELEITDSYNLDYLHGNSTNFEYGGMGEHAKLHKVIIDGDENDNRILWHEWSQWQGSELDSGCLLTVDEALDRLENHPELEEITVWLGVIEDAENK